MKQLFSRIAIALSRRLAKLPHLFRRKAWLAFFLGFSFAIATGNPATSYPQPSLASELRGVWLTNIDSEVLFSKASTDKAIKTLAQLNFNTVYPTVWNWGYTLYPSQVARRVTGQSLDPTPGLQGRDMLEEIIKQGHQQGIAVIPWFEFGFMAPADSELARRHPEWLTQRQDGSRIWWEGNVHQRVWLNPLHPEVQQFITDLVVEIASNYEVDGIQFDDHLGFPSDFGYDRFTVQLYQQEHGGELPPTDSQDSGWVRWRADKITDYMQRLCTAIRQANPKILVSLSPNPQKFSLESYLLDWQTWRQMGLIQELVLQVYRNNLGDFIGELEQPEVKAALDRIPVGIGILSGLKGHPVSLEQIQRQVQAVRDRRFSGVSFFFYESLWNLGAETPQARQSTFQSIFSNSAKRPNFLSS